MTDKTQKSATVYFGWSLKVECPNCQEDLDLATGDYDNDLELSDHVFNNKWEKLKGFVVKCESCKKEFKIRNIEV